MVFYAGAVQVFLSVSELEGVQWIYGSVDTRTLEEGKYQVFQFRSRMLRISKYSAIYAVVPDGRGAQFALAFGQKLKAPLTASPPVYRAEY